MKVEPDEVLPQKDDKRAPGTHELHVESLAEATAVIDGKDRYARQKHLQMPSVQPSSPSSLPPSVFPTSTLQARTQHASGSDARNADVPSERRKHTRPSSQQPLTQHQPCNQDRSRSAQSTAGTVPDAAALPRPGQELAVPPVPARVPTLPSQSTTLSASPQLASTAQRPPWRSSMCCSRVRICMLIAQLTLAVLAIMVFGILVFTLYTIPLTIIIVIVISIYYCNAEDPMPFSALCRYICWKDPRENIDFEALHRHHGCRRMAIQSRLVVRRLCAVDANTDNREPWSSRKVSELATRCAVPLTVFTYRKQLRFSAPVETGGSGSPVSGAYAEPSDRGKVSGGETNADEMELGTPVSDRETFRASTVAAALGALESEDQQPAFQNAHVKSASTRDGTARARTDDAENESRTEGQSSGEAGPALQVTPVEALTVTAMASPSVDETRDSGVRLIGATAITFKAMQAHVGCLNRRAEEATDDDDDSEGGPPSEEGAVDNDDPAVKEMLSATVDNESSEESADERTSVVPDSMIPDVALSNLADEDFGPRDPELGLTTEHAIVDVVGIESGTVDGEVDSDGYNDELEDHGLKCDICLTDYEEGDLVAWSPNKECIHSYHRDCILDWMEKKSTCPHCRSNYFRSNSEKRRMKPCLNQVLQVSFDRSRANEGTSG